MADELKKKLDFFQKKMSAYNYALSLIYYDGATGAPPGTAKNRGAATGVLSEEMYKLSTDSELTDTLLALEKNIGSLDEVTKRRAELELKNLERIKKIPLDFIKQIKGEKLNYYFKYNFPAYLYCTYNLFLFLFFLFRGKIFL